jgi:hypothetical protein
MVKLGIHYVADSKSEALSDNAVLAQKYWKMSRYADFERIGRFRLTIGAEWLE